MTELVNRTDVFNLVAQGVAGGLVPPWRVYLDAGCRHLALNVADADEWAAWRSHFGCPDLTIRVYESAGYVRRSSVAETILGGCRIAVELIEDIDTGDLPLLLGQAPLPETAL
jgi:hypothetical protein